MKIIFKNDVQIRSILPHILYRMCILDDNITDTYATSDEVIHALENLNKADQIRLNRFAKYRILELQHCNWEDLLSTAIERAITGSRKWPQKISIFSKSIKSNLICFV